MLVLSKIKTISIIFSPILKQDFVGAGFPRPRINKYLNPHEVYATIKSQFYTFSFLNSPIEVFSSVPVDLRLYLFLFPSDLLRSVMQLRCLLQQHLNKQRRIGSTIQKVE